MTIAASRAYFPEILSELLAVPSHTTTSRSPHPHDARLRAPAAHRTVDAVHATMLPWTERLRTADTTRTRPVDAHSEHLAHGTVVGGRHVIQQWWGETATAELYRVRHATISTLEYVLKALKPIYRDDPRIAQRFHAEASIVAGLQDAHILRITDIGTLSDGRPFLCREYYPGVELDEYLRHAGAQSESVTCWLAAALLSAVAELHRNGMAHGGLHPARIRLCADPQSREVCPRIVDFGTVRAVGEGDDGTVISDHMTRYRSTAAGAADPRADVYALGCIIAELLDGVPVYDKQGADRWHAARPNQRHAPIGALTQASGIAVIVRKATHTDPQQRYANAAEMLHALTERVRTIDPEFASDLPKDLVMEPSRGFMRSQNAAGQDRTTDTRIGQSVTVNGPTDAHTQRLPKLTPANTSTVSIASSRPSGGPLPSAAIAAPDTRTRMVLPSWITRVWPLLGRSLAIVLFIAIIVTIMLMGLPG